MTQLVAKQPRSVNTSLYSDSISSVSDSVLLVVRDLSEISRVREGGEVEMTLPQQKGPPSESLTKYYDLPSPRLIKI